DRRDARRDRARDGGDARDAEARPHRCELPAHRPAGRALRARRGGGDRPGVPAVDREAARLPGGVLVPSAAAQERRRGGGGRRSRPRALHAPGGPQPRHPADSVPQHGAARAGGHRGRRGPPLRGVPGERPGWEALPLIERCLWTETLPAADAPWTPREAGSVPPRADVAIIGGGYTGLAAARTLA